LVSETAEAKPVAHYEGRERTDTKYVIAAMAALFALNLLLRLFYFRYDFVNGDETVRALTAARVLEGARLYADVVTDKPPGATLFYAAVFALFGRSMVAVHMAAALWNFATAIVIYLTAASFYGRRAGLWAALLFVYFSTNYLTQDVMAANTELLMALPYSAAFYFFAAAHARLAEGFKSRAAIGLLIAGVMTGLSALFKQVGVLNLAFFAAYEVLVVYASRRRLQSADRGLWPRAARSIIAHLLLIAAGFAIVLALFAAWLIRMEALDDFWLNAVVLGKLYVSSVPPGLWIKYLIGRSLSYVLFNAALWWLAAWAAVRAIAEYRSHNASNQLVSRQVAADLAVTLWGVAGLAAVCAGGRFFGHYFIQLLPALALLGARGVTLLGERLSRRSRGARVIAAALVFLFLFGFIRFHQRTAVLAYEALVGRQTRWSEPWGMTERQREAQVLAERLCDMIGEGEPLYIWGTALDVYWRTRTRPASRYLTPYYITGEFPDARESVERPEETFFRDARARLIEDLARERPRIILDVYGNLLSQPYTEIVDFIRANYKAAGKIGPDPARPFVVLLRKEKD
jgi:4-amino-4-deoxy-L-arabinose transferase-like glycosyltransferase